MAQNTKTCFSQLVKLTLGFNFPNIKCAAFTHVDPKSAKNTGKIFVLLGSACIKAACKMLMKSTPCFLRYSRFIRAFNNETVNKKILKMLKLKGRSF